MIEFDDTPRQAALIKVVGIGGGGGNAVQNMIRSGLSGVEFIVANTDVQALKLSSADLKLQLGQHHTKGLGAGADPNIGRNAALEDSPAITQALTGADMVFITAGLGGGTGTGAAPIVAALAREMGALTVGVVTKPFLFEGRRRMRLAEEGLQNLAAAVDSLITIPNDRLLALAPSDMSALDAFKLADEVLMNAVRGISDLITVTGYINVDFADVRTVMSQTGRALMGTGYASGPNRSEEAAQMAISSPLLEDCTIDGATGILINITGPPDLGLHEINQASSLIQEAAHEEANIIFGTVIDESLQDEVKITVIATGFNQAVGNVSEYEEHREQDVARMLSRRREGGDHQEPLRRTGEFPAQPATVQVGTWRTNTGRFSAIGDEMGNRNNTGKFLAITEEAVPGPGKRLAKVLPNGMSSVDLPPDDVMEEPAFLRKLRTVRGT
ncbi:MAG: cell division protein FtsZ [Bradymonadales bacterium]|nr:cell division protein FtsZ [Bradymonadales bacterium]